MVQPGRLCERDYDTGKAGDRARTFHVDHCEATLLLTPWPQADKIGKMTQSEKGSSGASVDVYRHSTAAMGDFNSPKQVVVRSHCCGRLADHCVSDFRIV